MLLSACPPSVWRGIHGYTLTEVLLTVAIIGIVASTGPTIMTQMTKFFQLNQARIAIQRDGRSALDIINRQLRQAKASSIVVSQRPAQLPYSMISFTSIDGTSWKFYQEGKKLYTMQNTSTKTLCENIRYIAFSYPKTNDDAIISVAITLEKQTYSAQTKALQLSVEKVRIMND